MKTEAEILREQSGSKITTRTKAAATAQKSRREYRKHGHFKRVNAIRRHGYSAIDGRTYAGREAKRWRAAALEQKGGKSCPLHVRLEIDAATLDVWLMLELAEVIAMDAKQRGTVLNRRANVLPKLHEQYQTIAVRFAKHSEALELDKGGLDLARRLMQEPRQRRG
jgi:hypothetical protein